MVAFLETIPDFFQGHEIKTSHKILEPTQECLRCFTPRYTIYLSNPSYSASKV